MIRVEAMGCNQISIGCGVYKLPLPDIVRTGFRIRGLCFSCLEEVGGSFFKDVKLSGSGLGVKGSGCRG